MIPATDSHLPILRGSGPARFCAGRSLVLAVLAALVGIGPAVAQQPATIQASAVVMASFVEVAMAPAADAGVAGLPRVRSSGGPAVADERLLRVRGVAGASLRTELVAARGPSVGRRGTSPARPATTGATAGGARTLWVTVEYPTT